LGQNIEVEGGAVMSFFNPINYTIMKIASIFLCFVLVCTIYLLGSCTAYQKAQWSAGGGAATHPMSGNQHQSDDCAHHPNPPNYMGGMSGTFSYSMQNENFPYCHKCGRNVNYITIK